MARRFRWLCVMSAGAMVVMLSLGHAGAADKTKVDEATQQVAEGARSLGYGEFGSGFADLIIGIGRTLVEGTVYTGKTIGEFFHNSGDENSGG
jgi:hypothetical protein